MSNTDPAPLAMITAGFPDYSEVFHFDWSGRYTLRVLIRRKGMARPLQTAFTLRRAL